MIIAHLAHIAFVVYMYISYQYFYVPHMILAGLASFLTALHVLLSIVILLSHDAGPGVLYPSANIKTILQRASAFLMLLMLPLHFRAYNFMGDPGVPLTQGQFIGKLLITLLFFAFVFLHIAISVPRACVTFGDVRSEKIIQRIERISFAVCVLLFVIASSAVIYVLASWPRV